MAGARRSGQRIRGWASGASDLDGRQHWQYSVLDGEVRGGDFGYRLLPSDETGCLKSRKVDEVVAKGCAWGPKSAASHSFSFALCIQFHSFPPPTPRVITFPLPLPYPFLPSPFVAQRRDSEHQPATLSSQDGDRGQPLDRCVA